jgi:type-F conjugative transfer system pilin assembly protein TrbC
LEETQLLSVLANILLIFIVFPSFSERHSAFTNQHLSQDPAIQKLQEDSQNKIDTLLKDKEFQDIVSTLEAKASCSATNLSLRTSSKDANSVSKSCQMENEFEHLRRKSLRLESPSDLSSENLTSTRSGGMFRPGNFYIFVSLSLGEKALFNLAIDAKRYGATLVLRGFKAGSYVKTVHALQKIIQETGQGLIIDPELFTLFAIQTVPTFVLSKPFHLNASERIQTSLHDRIQGHVSPKYALETFAKEGDLKDEAKSLLLAGEAK